jgi:integrase
MVPYALRHTMATLVLHATKDLKLVAARLGHADETLVLRTYGSPAAGRGSGGGPAPGAVIRPRADVG